MQLSVSLRPTMVEPRGGRTPCSSLTGAPPHRAKAPRNPVVTAPRRSPWTEARATESHASSGQRARSGAYGRRRRITLALDRGEEKGRSGEGAHGLQATGECGGLGFPMRRPGFDPDRAPVCRPMWYERSRSPASYERREYARSDGPLVGPLHKPR